MRILHAGLVYPFNTSNSADLSSSSYSFLIVLLPCRPSLRLLPPFLQVDEPALREGLPLKASRRQAYLRWAVDSFRLATACAAPEVQVVTHLCYSDFGDIMQAIQEMDGEWGLGAWSVMGQGVGVIVVAVVVVVVGGRDGAGMVHWVRSTLLWLHFSSTIDLRTAAPACGCGRASGKSSPCTYHRDQHLCSTSRLPPSVQPTC